MAGHDNANKGSPSNLLTKTSRLGEEPLSKSHTDTANDSKHIASKELKDDTGHHPLSGSIPGNGKMENL